MKWLAGKVIEILLKHCIRNLMLSTSKNINGKMFLILLFPIWSWQCGHLDVAMAWQSNNHILPELVENWFLPFWLSCCLAQQSGKSNRKDVLRQQLLRIKFYNLIIKVTSHFNINSIFVNSKTNVFPKNVREGPIAILRKLSILA